MQTINEARQDREFHTPDGRGPHGEVIKPAVKARQGALSGRVLVVLVASATLLVIAFAISYVGAV